ncbi:hypothetical protein MN086_06885 [Sulfurovum sp. XGS-02]|uniref:hypothetical protein n=1 Tax=Sulfurovum sp. XGS-02 TaxID=2925411 RepID=UPI00206318F3|nr:hypothetical protein [Sulfurovum sp. XGS-02]UPT76777.1 hypothetical protein MN086_06885 [Sulfurovum sp. XGS-02]
MKTILFFGLATLLHAEMLPHPFDVESGMVLYEISGGTQLTPETNLSIQGKATLRFKDWGEVKLEEESGVVVTTGALKHKQQVKRFVKHTKDTVITADYANEQLLERKKSSYDINSDDETLSLRKTGEETVAGVSCDIWEGSGVKKCIYKNIVLKLEAHIFDVMYVKEATKVIFDSNTSSEAYLLPDFPVQEFALFKDKIKTKNRYKSENVYKILQEAALGVSDINTSDSSDEERIKFINRMSKDMYKRQKKLLPKLLRSMKKTRECLQTVEDPATANQCMEYCNQIKVQMSGEKHEEITLWDEKQKDIILDKIEDEIIALQSRIPCVNRAKNMTDLSSCMK